jgi:hypothetical protein
VEISKLASPWLMVSKANGEVLSNKVASAERGSIGRQLLGNTRIIEETQSDNHREMILEVYTVQG